MANTIPHLDRDRELFAAWVQKNMSPGTIAAAEEFYFSIWKAGADSMRAERDLAATTFAYQKGKIESLQNELAGKAVVSSASSAGYPKQDITWSQHPPFETKGYCTHCGAQCRAELTGWYDHDTGEPKQRYVCSVDPCGHDGHDMRYAPVKSWWRRLWIHEYICHRCGTRKDRTGD